MTFDCSLDKLNGDEKNQQFMFSARYERMCINVSPVQGWDLFAPGQASHNPP